MEPSGISCNKSKQAGQRKTKNDLEQPKSNPKQGEQSKVSSFMDGQPH